MKKLYLPSLTLAGAVFNDSPELLERTCRVLRYCHTLFDCGSTLLFTATSPHEWFTKLFNSRVIQIPHLDRDAFQTWVVKSVEPYVQSDFLMWVGEDGFPLRPERWSDDFLLYDFLGAPWADGVVGNDGFCIQSRRYLYTLAHEMPWHPGGRNSDWWALHDNDPAKYGLSIAPVDVARRFSLETLLNPDYPDASAFGFHGRQVNPHDYQWGWTLIEASENDAAPGLVGPSTPESSGPPGAAVK